MEEKGRVEGWPFIPNHLLMEAFAAMLLIGGLVLIATYLPWPVGEPADPFTTLIPIFPEWYFISLFGFLKLWVWNIGPIPAKVVGIVGPLIFGLFLLLLPFWDKGDEIHPMKRKKGMVLMVLTLFLLIFLTYYAIIMEVS